MLYLDYAKKKENGYILNFFADSYDDLEEVSDGKEYITLNGVNYGVPMAESVVTITNKNGEKTTYVMGGDGQWVQGDVDISNYYTKEQSDEKFATKESSVKVNVTSTTEGNRHEFANIMVGTNIYELPDQPIFNYLDSDEELIPQDLDNVVIGPFIYYINQPRYNLGGSGQGTPLVSIHYNETKYDVPVVVSEDGKNVSGLQVGNTTYNIASGAASGPEIVLLEGTMNDSEKTFLVNFDSVDEYMNLFKKYTSGAVNIRINAYGNNPVHSKYICDVVFAFDYTYTGPGVAFAKLYAVVVNYDGTQSMYRIDPQIQ